MLAFAFAIFTSAFLVFQVQPIVARFILPWFGGSPGVWTTCMLFFQLGLLGGYFYAHVLAKRVALKRQPIIHLVLMLGSALTLPITPKLEWVANQSDPTIGVLVLLLTTVGFPFVILSASAPLLQHWFANVHLDKSPFRLYALSNAGSLLALLSYPFIIEPALSLNTQSLSWSTGYGIFFVFILWSAWPILRSSLDNSQALSNPQVSHKSNKSISADANSPWTDRLLWIVLAACGSVILLASTNQMSQDVAVVPFLWVLPLSFYLLSFIICFERDQWYYRPVWVTFFVVSVTALVYLMHQDYADEDLSLALQILIYISAMFSCCMLCHGELVRRRPEASDLTAFYLYVSLGGAIGGILVGVVAPAVFVGFWELHIVLVAVAMISGGLIFHDTKTLDTIPKRASFSLGWSLGVIVLAFFLYDHADVQKDESIHNTRGFYGVLHVYEFNPGDEDYYRALYHGRINHGEQWFYGQNNMKATTYYGPRSGVGLSISQHPARKKSGIYSGMKVGIIGLGVGTLASYGKVGDKFRFYEINQQTQDIAQEHFSFLSDSAADIEVIIGDGRVSLANELKEGGSQQFDVIVVDAFSGDSIPIHLLTTEAMALYRAHLKPDGVIAFHVTNIHINLFDVVRQLAKSQDMQATHIDHYAENDFEYGNDWVLVSNNSLFLNDRAVQKHANSWEGDPKNLIWTDDFSNLFDAVEW